MSGDLKNIRIALVHDWLVSLGGAERVLFALHEMFPDAPIYTLVYDHERAPQWLRGCDVRTTYLQRIPGATIHHKMLLSFMPRAWEALNLEEFDLVISSCMCCCKGVITRPDALHVCYCHSPTRYLWDLYFEYLDHTDVIRRAAMKSIVPRIREWDYLAAQRVDHFIANSDYVAKRISKYYRRESITIHPGSQIAAREVVEAQGYYLVVSRFVRYKRLDLAIEACNRLGRRLVIVGPGGEEERSLRELAGPTIEFRVRVSDEEMASLYAGADALIFPGVEDFGLTPVEAASAGVPTLAFGRGGVLETVRDGETGLFFREQTVTSIGECIERFERDGVALTREQIHEHSFRFSNDVFEEKMMAYLTEKCSSLM